MVAGVDGAAGFDAGGGAGGDGVAAGVDAGGWTEVVRGFIARGRNGAAFLTVRAGARRAIALSPWIDI